MSLVFPKMDLTSDLRQLHVRLMTKMTHLSSSEQQFQLCFKPEHWVSQNKNPPPQQVAYSCHF